MFGEGVAVAGQHAVDHRPLREVQEHAFAQQSCAFRGGGRVVQCGGDGGASASGSFGLTRASVNGPRISGMPPTFAAIIGIPAAAASITT